MNIPVINILCTGLVGVVCTFAPVLLALWLHRQKGAASSFFWGCAAYAVLELALQRTTTDLLALLPISQQTWFTVLYSGITAASAAVFGLCICFCWPMKERRTLQDALLAGLGYAWCDSFLMTGLDMLYASLLSNALRKSPELLLTPETEEMYNAFASQIANTQPVQVLLVGLARLAAVAMVAALAVLLMAGFVRRRVLPMMGYYVLYFGCAALCVWVSFLPSGALWQTLVQLVFTGLLVLLALGGAKQLPAAAGQTAPASSNTVTWNAPLKRRKL